jgi:hypothetical protein
MERVHAKGTLGIRMVDMRYEIFRSGTGGTCNAVRIGIDGEECDMHSGGVFVLVVEGNISERDLSVVFVLQ